MFFWAPNFVKITIENIWNTLFIGLISLPISTWTSLEITKKKCSKYHKISEQITFFLLITHCTGFVGSGLGFASREYLVWYVLFIVFVPYAMLPLPLKWCVVAGSTSSICHLFVTSLARLLDPNVVSWHKNRNKQLIYYAK